MTKLPSIHIRSADHSDEQIFVDFEAMTIPRIGEDIYTPPHGWQTVVAIQYMYPQPGSPNYVTGGREPIVDLIVEPSPDQRGLK